MEGQVSEFFLSCWQKSEERAKKCIELGGEYVEYILILVDLACTIPGWAKELSAHHRKNTACRGREVCKFNLYNI